MDHQNWHWKHSSSSTDSDDSPSTLLSRHSDDQNVHSAIVDMEALKSNTLGLQISENVVKRVTEKPSEVLLDDLVNQRAKVAEKSVSGWGKDEVEAGSVKEQLDVAIMQKLAAEDRVSHLEKALKECMQQLQHAREEQEEKIHEVIVKKTREWEKAQCELEEKLEDFTKKLSEAELKNRILAKSLLQDASRMQNQVSEVEVADSTALRLQVERLEKENSSLKHEIQVSQKELELCKGGRERWKKNVDIGNKKAWESIKVNKSEAGNFRIHADRKLLSFSPWNEARGKHESSKKRHIVRVSSSSRRSVDSIDEFSSNNDGSKELFDRLDAMEKETQAQKELLDRRNEELKDARMMCVRTASKLSSVEEKLITASHMKGNSTKGEMGHLNGGLGIFPSLSSRSEDGTDENSGGSESWPTSLITGIAQTKREKDCNLQKSIDVCSLELMDDFVEMERLLSNDISQTELKDHAGVANTSIVKDFHSENSLDIYEEGEKSRIPVLEASSKRTITEERLSSLQLKNDANELNLASLREGLDIILDAQHEGADITSALHELKSMMGASHYSIARLKAHVKRLSRVCSAYEESSVSSLQGSEFSNHVGIASSIETSSEEDNSFNKPESRSKAHLVRPWLVSSVSKIVYMIEEFSKSITSALQLSVAPFEASACIKSANFSACVREFVMLADNYLQRKAHTAKFMRELAVVVGRALHIAASVLNGVLCSERNGGRTTCNFNGVNVASCPGDDNNTDDGWKIVFGSLANHQNRTSSVHLSKLKDDLQKVETEKESLEHHLKEESLRLSAAESELAELNTEKLQLENELAASRDRIESLEAQLCNAESSDIAALKQELEIELKASKDEMKHLHEKVNGLEQRVTMEQQKCKNTDAKCQYYRWKLKEARMCCPRCVAGIEESKHNKAREITMAVEKLDECQQTILVLGKELKELVLPKICMEASLNSSTFLSFNNTYQENTLSQQGQDGSLLETGRGGEHFETSCSASISEQEEERDCSIDSEEDKRIEENPSWTCNFQNRETLNPWTF